LSGKDGNSAFKSMSTWNRDTSPFVVVRHVATHDVTDDQITHALEKDSIKSLRDLSRNFLSVAKFVPEDAQDDVLIEIFAALKCDVQTPEQVLGGKLCYDKTCISDKPLALYTPEAVSVRPNAAPDRTPNFTLVHGPSGSGKTIFAMECLPEWIFPGAISEKKSFRVHLKAVTLLGDDPKSDCDLPALVAGYVHEQITALLPNFDGVSPLNLFLHVTIDEAGRDDYKHFLDTAGKIEAIVTALTNMHRYKFQQGVHVTVTGTSLEISTKSIDSNLDTVKYHMQPWTLDNFHAFLDKSKRVDKGAIKTIITRFPILEDLTTNARCSYFLVDSMPNITATDMKRWRRYVDISVSNVTQRYVHSNGLAILSTPDQKLKVAQAAFKAINDAIKQPKMAAFPNFNYMQDKALRGVAQSLLQINLEIRNDKAIFMDQGKYSVSMTPAIAVVLAELLDEDAAISWDWQGFESTAALGEWKRMITAAQEPNFLNRFGIIHMATPVPAGNAETSFTLPFVNSLTVLVNGPRAQYADVIAPFRLVQAKFSKDRSNEKRLQFEKELGKMGLANGTKYQLQQAVTSALYVMWQRPYANRAKTDSADPSRLPFLKKERCEHYPFQTMLSGYFTLHQEVNFCIEGANVTPVDEGAHLFKKKPINVLELFTQQQPITALFVTNAASFVLEKDGEVLITIERDDVDWQGILKEPLPQHMVETLRKNVEVRFMFY
jgi:hypothetical protein